MKGIVMLRKVLSCLIVFTLIMWQTGFAQVEAQLNIAAYLGRLHQTPIDKLRLPVLRYFSYDNLNNSFKIILDKGDLKGIKPQELEKSSQELLKYFLIGITLPNESFWVNLRPDSPENIIDDYLAQTDIGKAFLEADLQLKKDTAQFTSPQTPEGKLYWDKLYKKAGELFGSENISIPTLTRPWIVPGEVIIRETQDSAYVYKATLKVMLEEDYIQGGGKRVGQVDYSFKDPRLKALNEYSSELIREFIIPKLTKEVNISKRYAPLRQVYYSLILSRWFKSRFNGKEGLYASLINKRNLTNLTSKENWSKTTYFKEYQKSFKNGEYNLNESVYTPFGQTIRSYFSGGIGVTAENLTIPQPNTQTIAGSPAVVVGGVFRTDNQVTMNEKNILGVGEADLDNLLPDVRFVNASTTTTDEGIEMGGTESSSASPVERQAIVSSPLRVNKVISGLLSSILVLFTPQHNTKASVEVPPPSVITVAQQVGGDPWFGQSYSGRRWASMRHDFRRPRNVSGNDTLVLQIENAPAGARVVVQLLSVGQADGDSGGSTEPITLKGGRQTLRIPLQDFGGVNLEQVRAIVVHHGEEFHGVTINRGRPYVQVESYQFTGGGGALKGTTKQSASLPTVNTNDDGRGVGSAVRASSPVGGIDLGNIQWIIQPIGNFTSLKLNAPSISVLQEINLDEEFKKICSMVRAGILPSSQRLKDFIYACYYKQELANRIADLVSCLTDICRLQEEYAEESAPEFKESLMLVEAG